MNCEMHLCLRDTMRVSRWAGMFPVEGLDKLDVGELRFNVKSFYTVYYIITIAVQTIMTVLITDWFFSNNLSLDTVSLLLFSITALTSSALLLKLAGEWPRLIRKAAGIERRISAMRVSKNRAVKINAITYIVLISAVIEHILSLIHKAKNVLLCEDADNDYSKTFLEIYFYHAFPFVFKYVPRNYFTMTICTLTNVQATFLWNFTDVMIMSFSMYLISYFQDLNTLVNSQKDKKTHDWEQLRIHYSKLVALVQAVDSKMCYMILLSILTNLFFICLQLFNTLNYGLIRSVKCTNSLQQEKSNIDRRINLFYFAYSFLFLVTRATVMLFLAANVNTAAMMPKYALSCVPHTDYNIHVQRFNRQLRYTTTALSGVFFYVTRNMILKVFATIVTYELVLVQFNK